MLSELNAEIKAPSSEEWSSVKTQTLSQKSQFVNLDLSDYLTDSGEYDIRISVADAAGNTETVESKFTYAKNEMSEFEVTAVADGCSIRLDWTSASDSSDVYYEIRRKDADGTEKYIATTRANELSYTDSGLYPLKEYAYSVVAHDENMYTAKSNTTNIKSGNDTIAPIAHAGNSSVIIAEQTIKFDGSRSSDNFGIKEYLWDFGDGTTGTGKISEHAYSTAGTYNVTLTVTDESGNSDTDTLTVTVYDKNHCMVRIKVTDDSGEALPSAVALCTLPDIEETMFYSNADGEISLVATKGTYDFYFFANGCLPLKKSITLEASNSGSANQTITLTRSNLVTYDEFKIEPLNIEEMLEHGIDINDEDNQYVCKVKMKVDNVETGRPEDVEVIVTQNGEMVRLNYDNTYTTCKSIDSEKDDGKTKTKTSTSTLQFNITNKVEHMPPQMTTMVSMSLTEFSWMKDFFEVSITLHNNAEIGFDILNPKATLNLPSGLSLAAADKDNPAVQTLNTIEGGTAKTFKWIIKGDRKGKYDISVDFEGLLTPFGIPIEARFENGTPIEVRGGEDLLLTLNPSLYYTEFSLTNMSDRDIYNVRASINSYGEFKDAVRIVAKYPSGLTERTEWKDASKTEIKSKVYLPVNVDIVTDMDSLRTLKPGECIEGVIWYQ